MARIYNTFTCEKPSPFSNHKLYELIKCSQQYIRQRGSFKESDWMNCRIGNVDIATLSSYCIHYVFECRTYISSLAASASHSSNKRKLVLTKIFLSLIKSRQYTFLNCTNKVIEILKVCLFLLKFHFIR